MSGTDARYSIERRWWLPLFVEVWDAEFFGGPVENWRRGPYILSQRRGVFFRRRTARRYVEWLKANDPVKGNASWGGDAA